MKTRHFLTVAEKIEVLDFHEKKIKKFRCAIFRQFSAINMKKLSQKVSFNFSFQFHFMISIIFFKTLYF